MRFFIISTMLFQLFFNSGLFFSTAIHQTDDIASDNHKLTSHPWHKLYNMAYSPVRLMENIFTPIQERAHSSYDVLLLGDQFKNWTLNVEYNHRDKWVIAGKNSEEQDFSVKKEHNSVILEFEEKHEELAAQEIKFLLLNNHIELLINSVKQEEYRYIAISEVTHDTYGEIWKVNIDLPSTMVSALFSEYLQEHFETHSNALAISDYSLQYDIYLDPHAENISCLEITFSLLKGEATLEKIFFILQD